MGADIQFFPLDKQECCSKMSGGIEIGIAAEEVNHRGTRMPKDVLSIMGNIQIQS
jgi:hypothetical protein